MLLYVFVIDCDMTARWEKLFLSRIIIRIRIKNELLHYLQIKILVDIIELMYSSILRIF